MRLSLFLSLSVMLVATVTFAAQAGKKGTKAPQPAARQPATDPADDEDQASPKKPSDDERAPAKKSDDEAEDADDDSETPDATAKTPTKKPAGLKLTDADESQLQKHFSYIQGYYLGRTLREAGIELDHKTFDRAIDDAKAEKEPDMSQEDMQAAMQSVQKRLEQKQASRLAEMARKNKKEEDAFLTANKKKEGVKTLPSGLQYKVLKSGNGKSPKATDTVKVDYKGTLLDGTEFDSSYTRGEPITMRVDQFISGWKQALPLMKTGDHWQLFIPSVLAYGQKGNQVIAPNSMLVFELELLEINPKTTKPIKP